ncbi:MAG: glycosyltransferase [Chloroflexota bacterium]
MQPGIIMLVNEFPPLPAGGAERQAERLSQYLASRGWAVSVITRRAPGLPAREPRSGFQILRPPALGPGKLRTVSFVLGAMALLWQRRAAYAILHAHLAFGPAFAGLVMARLLGKKVIVKLGNSGAYGDIRVSQATRRGRLRLAALRRWADAIITLDEAMYAEAVSAGFDTQRLLRMNNGIDARDFAPRQPAQAAKAALGLQDALVALYAGRLAEQKSLPVLLEALQLAAPACPALRLLLLGDGPERPALEAQAAALGLQERVIFAGRQADVRPYLEAADLFVLPSTVEGISNALLEAMAAGLTCLAAAVGGSPEVLHHGRCGRLLPAGDAAAWGQALTELYHDPAQRAALGQAAVRRVLDCYDFAVTGAQVEALYHDLLAGRRPAQAAAGKGQ